MGDANKNKPSYTLEKMQNYLETKFQGHEFALFCLLYVNDMPEYLNDYKNLFIYADDTTVVVSEITIEEAIEKV